MTALNISPHDEIIYRCNGMLSMSTVKKIAHDGLVVLDNGHTILADCVTCVVHASVVPLPSTIIEPAA